MSAQAPTDTLRRLWAQDVVKIAALLVVIYGSYLVSGLVLGYSVRGQLNSLASLTFYIGVFATLALALNLHWGYTGLFNIGVVGFMAVGIYVMAFVSKPLYQPGGAAQVGGLGLPIIVGMIAGTVAAALVGGAALVGAGIAGAAGTDQWATAVVGTVVALLLVVHLDRVWAGGRLAALAFPLSLVAGIGAGVILVRTTGIRSPPTWLDWGYLTAAHSQVAADAGIYPALVGSVLMMIVVALVAFPLGVGAALYGALVLVSSS